MLRLEFTKTASPSADSSLLFISTEHHSHLCDPELSVWVICILIPADILTWRKDRITLNFICDQKGTTTLLQFLA